MTDQPSPPPPAVPRRRNPALTVLMVLVGLVLLLPGLCALVFAIGFGGDGSSLIPLWLICLLISAGGVALLLRAFR